MPNNLSKNSDNTLRSSAENFRFRGNLKHAVKHDTMPKTLTGNVDNIKEYSLDLSLHPSETSTVALSVVTSDLDIQTFSTISSIETNNTENNITDEKGEPFQMSLGADIGWTLVFGLMIGGAIVGNLVVLWIVLGN